MAKITRSSNGTLSYDSGEPEKRKPERKRPSVHKCSEKVQLDRMRLILVGNGDPKTGLAFKMEAATEDIADIKDAISSINDQLKESFTAASTAASSLEKYKIEVKAFELGKDDVKEKQKLAEELKATRARDKRYMIFQIVSLCLILAGLVWSIYNSKIVRDDTSSIKSETKVTNEILDNAQTRGEHYVPPVFKVDTINTVK